jgi:hypothetical protein
MAVWLWRFDYDGLIITITCAGKIYKDFRGCWLGVGEPGAGRVRGWALAWLGVGVAGRWRGRELAGRVVGRGRTGRRSGAPDSRESKRGRCVFNDSYLLQKWVKNQ